jgi:hypothetical protein
MMMSVVDAGRWIRSRQPAAVNLVVVLVHHVLDVVRHFLEFLEPQLGRLLADVPVLLGVMQGRPVLSSFLSSSRSSSWHAEDDEEDGAMEKM